MEKRIDIQEELRAISPILASMTSQVPFLAPPGYFDLLPERLLGLVLSNSKVLADDQEMPVIDLPQLDKGITMSVPDGYFEGFAAGLMTRIKSGESRSSDVHVELESIAPVLNGIGKRNPYAVPVGYFEKSAELMSGSSMASSADKDGEFPILNGASSSVYSVPRSYFDELPGLILNKVGRNEQAKVIPFTPKRNWKRLAAAAIVVGFLATGSLLWMNKHHSTATTENASGLAMVSDQEILNYLEVQSTPAASADANTSVATADISDAEAGDLFNDIPDEELQQYVDDHANAKGLITN